LGERSSIGDNNWVEESIGIDETNGIESIGVIDGKDGIVGAIVGSQAEVEWVNKLMGELIGKDEINGGEISNGLISFVVTRVVDGLEDSIGESDCFSISSNFTFIVLVTKGRFVFLFVTLLLMLLLEEEEKVSWVVLIKSWL
jgi:hypothetical protein